LQASSISLLPFYQHLLLLLLLLLLGFGLQITKWGSSARNNMNKAQILLVCCCCCIFLRGQLLYLYLADVRLAAANVVAAAHSGSCCRGAIFLQLLLLPLLVSWVQLWKCTAAQA
jgi:hypothetical protein